MDTPATLSWDQLTDLAADRQRWRQRVYHLRNPDARSGLEVTITINPLLPGCTVSRCARCPPPKPKARAASPSARKYLRRRVREAHNALFEAKPPPPPCDKKKKKRNKTSKALTGTAVLTNKQRKQWARDHYELHHGRTTEKFFVQDSTPTMPATAPTTPITTRTPAAPATDTNTPTNNHTGLTTPMTDTPEELGAKVTPSPTAEPTPTPDTPAEDPRKAKLARLRLIRRGRFKKRRLQPP